MPDGEPSSSRRGLGREAPVVLAVLAGFALLLLTPEAPADAGRLEAFLRDGPAPGVWEIQSFMGTRRYVFAPDAGDARCRFVAPMGEDGFAGDGRIVPQKRAAQWFVPGCRQRFLNNYRIQSQRETPEGLEVLWRPRMRDRGDTARRVWIDPEAGRVVRLEDRAANGEIIRRVRFLAPLPPEVPPASSPSAETTACLERAAREASCPPSLDAVQELAPYRILRPAALPAGFGLKEAVYREVSTEVPGIVWLTFTDGLATFALAMGPPASMAAFECHVGASCESGVATLAADAGCCIRTHHAPQRTVLRVDDRHGLSVVLLGRNELPESAYVRVMTGLRPMAGARRSAE